MLKILLIYMLSLSLIYGQEKSYPEIDSMLLQANPKFHKEGKLKEGIQFNLKLLEKCRKQNYEKGIGWSYVNIGNLYSTLSQYNESLRYLYLAEKIIYKTEDASLKTRVNIEIGKVNQFLGLNDVALDYYNKAISEAGKNKDLKMKKRYMSYVYACKADNFKLMEQYDSLRYYFQKSFLIDGDPLTAANIADYFFTYKKENIDSAAHYLNIAEAKLRKNHYSKFHHVIVYSNYGEYYYEKKEFNKALNYFLKSLKIARELGKTNKVKLLYQNISKSYSALGENENATYYLQKYTRINDSLNKIEKQALNLSVKKLIKDKELENKMENSKIKDKNHFVLVIIISTAIILMILGYYFYRKKKKEKEILIQNQQTEIIKKDLEKLNLELKVNDAFKEVLELARKNDPIFLARFKEVYPEFCANLLHLFPCIASSELTFCAYLKLNLSSKEIAKYTFVTIRAVQIRKNRLRKKYNIDSTDDLYIWIQNL